MGEGYQSCRRGQSRRTKLAPEKTGGASATGPAVCLGSAGPEGERPPTRKEALRSWPKYSCREQRCDALNENRNLSWGFSSEAAGLGFEPRLLGPEPSVLPLDDPAPGRGTQFSHYVSSR